MKLLTRTILAVAVIAVSIEVALQLAALVVTDRSGTVRKAPITVLCVGDSHTFGGGVDPTVAYPAWLQRFLDRRAPGRFSVVNAGVPGMNTSMVRRRLPGLVERYHPQMILVWVGINDAWNLTDIAPVGWRERLDAWASHSRLYRLVRVRWNDRGLDRALASSKADTGRFQVVQTKDRWEIRDGDHIEQIDIERRPGMETDPVTAGRATENYRAMIRLAEAAGIPIAFIAYPADIKGFLMANTALRTSTGELGAPLIETAPLVMTVPEPRRIFLWAAHPNGWIYRAIAGRVAGLVLSSCKGATCAWSGR